MNTNDNVELTDHIERKYTFTEIMGAVQRYRVMDSFGFEYSSSSIDYILHKLPLHQIVHLIARCRPATDFESWDKMPFEDQAALYSRIVELFNTFANDFNNKQKIDELLGSSDQSNETSALVSLIKH